MRTIERTNAPECLAQQQANQDWGKFMGTPCHTVVGRKLRQEQHGLCCYCELEQRANNGHIEHMVPRKEKSERTYNYTNLAISCNGGAIEHCGRYKDDRAHNRNYVWDNALFVPPHDPSTSKLVRYLPDGSIAPTEVNPDKGAYLIGYLGLDCPRLSNRRLEHARMLIKTLGSQPEQDLVAWLRNHYLNIDANGQLMQFHSLSQQILES